MKSLTSVSLVLAAFAAGVQGKEEIPWPNNGAIKMITAAAPSQVTMTLPGCLSVNVNFDEDKVQVTTNGNGQAIDLPKNETLKRGGGQLVTLMSLENGEAHVIVNAESTDGGFESRMKSFPVNSCLISKLDVTSTTPDRLTDVKVGVNKPIEKIYREKRGFTSS